MGGPGSGFRTPEKFKPKGPAPALEPCPYAVARFLGWWAREHAAGRVGPQALRQALDAAASMQRLLASANRPGYWDNFFAEDAE